MTHEEFAEFDDNLTQLSWRYNAASELFEVRATAEQDARRLNWQDVQREWRRPQARELVARCFGG